MLQSKSEQLYFYIFLPSTLHCRKGGRTYPFVLEPPKPVFLLLDLWEAGILFLFLSFLVLFAK